MPLYRSALKLNTTFLEVLQFTDYKVEPDGDQQVDLVNALSCDQKRLTAYFCGNESCSIVMTMSHISQAFNYLANK